MKKDDKKLTIILSVALVLMVINLISYPIYRTIKKEQSKNELIDSVNNIVLTAKQYYEGNDFLNKDSVVFNIENGKIIEDGLDYSGYLPDEGKIFINKFGQIEIIASDKSWCITKRYVEDELIVEEYQEICELIDTTKLGNIAVSIETDGPGLYQSNNIFLYRGKDPNNYIILNDIMFRIISIDKQGNVKVIMNDSITSRNWNNDSRTNNSFEINNMDNIGYYLNYQENEYIKFEQLKNGSNVIEYEWNLEKFNYSNNQVFYELNQNNIVDTALANVGMIYATEYVHASLNESCLLNTLRNTNCGLDNYLNINNEFFTMSQSEKNIWAVSKDGKLYETTLNIKLNVRPVLVLTNEIILKGKGTIENPYEIVTK